MRKCSHPVKYIVCLWLMLCFIAQQSLLSGCSSRKNSASDETDSIDLQEVVLDAPEYESKEFETSGDEASEEEEVELEQGYRKVNYGDYTIYIAYIDENDRVPGVEYLEEAFSSNSESIEKRKALIEYNKPDGTSSLDACSGISYIKAGSPFIDDTETLKDTKSVKNVFSIITNNYIDNATVTEHTITNYDVEAISIARYESFYNQVPDLTIKIYGISHDTWNTYLGNNLTYSYNQYESMLTELEESNYSQCTLLATKSNPQTGVYYVDYHKLNDKNEYQQFLVSVEYGEYIKEYSYMVDGAFNYTITDTSSYQSWKQMNIDMFIGE